jgi:predicted small secreted protein
MKKLIISALAAAALLVANNTFAADKDVTLTGEGKCAKCALKLTKQCQNVIEVQEGGKKVTYWIAKNEVSDKFHENLCKGPAKITAVGKVSEKEGKKMLVASKLDVVK